jgi:hypothetical protein
MWKKNSIGRSFGPKEPMEIPTFFGVGSSIGALCSFGTASARLDAEQKWEGFGKMVVPSGNLT